MLKTQHNLLYGDNVKPFAIPGENLAKNQIALRNIVAAGYLSGRDNPKAYGKDWEKLVVELRSMMRDPQLRAALGDIEDDVLFSDLTLDVQHENARQLYSSFKQAGPLVKADLPKNFIVPNKPMYRIFEIDDLEEINGFTGYFIIQEKFDGLRIQEHKLDGKVSIYTNRGNDITDKLPECVKFFEKEELKDFILDGEAVLYKDNDPLVRSDTIAFINRKERGDGDIRLHIFDIMHYDGEEVYKEKLEDRLGVMMEHFAAFASDEVSFPNKSNTREADSMEELSKYAEEIMNNPTSEGVVIKDAKSSYIVGRKKNPKWVKWKKFVDLDVIILEKRVNKNDTFSYLMGVGPIELGPKAMELDGKKYMKVGRAGNYGKDLEIGSIIRVKVDDIVGNKEKGFTLNGAKVHEIPEVEEPDRVVTLELLSEGGRKSLGDYKVEALKKSYYVTDGIHGIAKADLEPSYDGLLFHGFDNNLMGKNAWADKEMWVKQLKLGYKKDGGVFFAMVENLLRNRSAQTAEGLYKLCVEEKPDLMHRLFGDKDGLSKMKQRLMKAGPANGIEYSNGKFSWDGETMKKAVSKKGQFEMWFTEEGSLHFIVYHQGKEYVWEIEVGEEDELYDFLGESGKYPAHVIEEASKDGLLDKGTLVIGAQRHGYHEYILTGEDIKSKLHFRYVEAFDDQKMWIAFTGFEMKPAPEDSDEGLVNIYEDKFANDMNIKKFADDMDIKKRNLKADGIVQLAVYRILKSGKQAFTTDDIVDYLEKDYNTFMKKLEEDGILTNEIIESKNVASNKRTYHVPMPQGYKQRVRKQNYDKLIRNLSPRVLGSVLTSPSKKGKITDLNGQEFISIKDYLLGSKFIPFLTPEDEVESYSERRRRKVKTYMTLAYFTNLRNKMLRDLEKNYRKIFEELSRLQIEKPDSYHKRVVSYEKFDIDLPTTIYNLLQQKSK